ncbi:uncharacterized protein LOC144147106 [Haemaphysalis longicornis]
MIIRVTNMEKERPRHHPVIVDRCWSLLPLSLISALVVCIFFKSAALFYVAFMEEFGISHQSASWPLNLTGMMQHLAGLLVWFLQDKMSLYHITLLGCVLNSASLIASAVVPDIVWMSITAGILNGVFRDTMGSYDNLYRLLSAFCAILAVVMLCFSSYEIRARKQLSESSRPFSVKL